jgi:hypothetical protein
LIAIALFCCVVRSRGEIFLPPANTATPITVRADDAARWQQGVYDVWHLRGRCEVAQGSNVARAGEAVLWVARPAENDPTRATLVIAYLEGDQGAPVVMMHGDGRTNRQELPQWFGEFRTTANIDWRVPQPKTPATPPDIYRRGMDRFAQSARASADTAVRPAQFEEIVPAPASQLPPAGPGIRRVDIIPRGEVGTNFDMPIVNGERVIVFTGGINVVVQGIDANRLELPPELGAVDTVDIETDKIVIWTGAGNPFSGTTIEQSANDPLEFYLEGNIVFRQGDRTVYADRMYYDARRKLGIVLNAELLTPLPMIDNYQYQGLVRLKAGVLQQLDESRFVAQQALFTTSRLEEPSYSLQADTVSFVDQQQPIIDPFTGQPAVNPFTNEPEFAHARLARGQNNFLYLGDVPVFYWPSFTTNLEEPTFYIDSLRFRNDRVFGFQTLVDLDVYQLMGAEPPAGTDWIASVDYLSERGLGLGTTYEYNRDSFLSVPGPVNGWFDTWFIKDDGEDNLGFGRRNIVPEESFRGRVFWNHRQKLVDGLLQDWTVQGQVGYISDRTFMEQYFENEWDNNPDQLTGFRLKRLFDNQALSIEANARINDFFTQTQWLPRVDHYLLGQELVGDTFTWFAHSQAAYANIGVASTPTNMTLEEQFSLFPWEIDDLGNRIEGNGERFATRQELDLPIDLSPFKVVPFVLGEAAHWGADRNGDDIQRLYFNTGLRASIPFWAVNPEIRDPLFNLNGLAHKVVFEVEASYADANRNYEEFPLYDEIDDDSIEDFRRRLFFSPFGGALAGTFYNPLPIPTIDPKFDPRFYLIRTGNQRWVTSHTTELVEDLALVRMGMRHRLQTKRGGPATQHIVDWLTLDTNITYFPDADRDNFGYDLGLADYDLRWHLGDRFSIVSDGAADFFGDALRTAAIGMVINRPARGNAYFGYRSIHGPFTSDVLLANFNYRFGPKWIGAVGTSVDLGEAGNINSSVNFSRIGESLIMTLGANYDQSKDNVGFAFLLEPRFLPRNSVTRRTGIDIPPAGAFGLE